MSREHSARYWLLRERSAARGRFFPGEDRSAETARRAKFAAVLGDDDKAWLDQHPIKRLKKAVEARPELKKTIETALMADIKAEPLDEALIGYSDGAIAMRVTYNFDGNVRHTSAFKRWAWWDGQTWNMDETDSVRNAIHEIMTEEALVIQRKAVQKLESAEILLNRAEVLIEGPDGAAESPGDQEAQRRKAKELQQQAKQIKADASRLQTLSDRLRKKKTLDDVTGLVMINGGVAAAADLWDQDLDTISTPGGVYDQRTGELVELGREAFSTMKTAVEPAPTGTAPTKFLKFLDQIFDGDRETIDFFQLWCGVILFGHQREEKLLFAHGSGRNGKSVLFNTLLRVM